MPVIMRKMQNIFIISRDSPSRVIPAMAVPAAPIPVQIA